MRPPHYRLRLPSRELVLGERTLLMGVLNVTPDSFSDGGHFLDPAVAVARALQMEAQGAGIIDVGGESTRPDAQPVSEAEELRRVLPVIKGLRGRASAPVSVDTYKPGVAAEAVAAGAEIINFPAFNPVPEMAEVARRSGAALIAMHSRGRPDTMHRLPPMADVLGEVCEGLRRLRDGAWAAGLPREALVLDPGFGFGKNGDENYRLLAGLARLHELGCPVLAGPSRKSFIGGTLGLPARAPESASPAAADQPCDGVHPRAWGTAATVACCVMAGAHIVRIHDVAEMGQVVRVAERIREFAE
jgi:dihydropteroate synthase